MATEILRPNANGDTIELEPDPAVDNYLNVDDEVTDEWDTSNYKYAETLDAKDLYSLPDHSSGSGTINKITVYANVAGSTGAGTVDAKLIVKTGGDIYEGDALGISVDETFENKSQIWETNPATETAWTWEDIDALQIGIHGYGEETGENVGVAISQIYLEVDYSEEESLGDIVLSLTDNKLTVTSGADEATYSITDNKITLVTGGNNYTFNPFESPYLKSIIDNLLTIDGSILTPDS